MDKFTNAQENDKAVNPYALQESIRKSSVLWLTKWAVTSIIINSFSALPLYCDRVFKGQEDCHKRVCECRLFLLFFYENSSDNFIKVVNEILI